MDRQRRHCGAGFTVIEALAAGMLLALAGMAIGRAVVGAMGSLRLSSQLQQAAQLLDQTLTRIDLIGPSRLLEEGPTEGEFDDNPGFRWSAEIEPRFEGYLYDVTVRVTWDTAEGPRPVEAATRLNDPPDSRSAAIRWDEL
jgi:type II secretory pathway pseudopilin PulG